MYTSETTIIVFFLVAIIAAYVLIPYLFRNVFNKGHDAIRNAHVRNQEANNPPQKERLADRYIGTQAGKSLNLTERQVPAAVSVSERTIPEVVVTAYDAEEELRFCPNCGMNLSELEADDHFCPECGTRLR